MVLMERIVRPHLPIESEPKKTAPKCREEEKNTEMKFDAPAGESSRGGQKSNDKKDKDQQPKKPKEKTRNSSWAYAYKLYMTKKERELEKCQPKRVVGGADTTDQPAPSGGGGGGGGGSSGGGSGGTNPV